MVEAPTFPPFWQFVQALIVVLGEAEGEGEGRGGEALTGGGDASTLGGGDKGEGEGEGEETGAIPPVMENWPTSSPLGF